MGANRKAAKAKGKTVKQFRPTSAEDDARIFAFKEKDWSVSLTVLGGREQIKLDVGNYQHRKLKGRQPNSAQLCQHKEGLFYLHIALTEDAPDPIQSSCVIGVDLGHREIAKTSTGNGCRGKNLPFKQG